MKSNFILILCLDELRNAGDALKPLVKESNSQKKDNFYLLGISDVDPNWLYADPDPQNLMNNDPDPG